MKMRYKHKIETLLITNLYGAVGPYARFWRKLKKLIENHNIFGTFLSEISLHTRHSLSRNYKPLNDLINLVGFILLSNVSSFKICPRIVNILKNMPEINY